MTHNSAPGRMARLPDPKRTRSGGPVEEYCLPDANGRCLGTVVAPEGRLEVGPSAPTIFLNRGR
jgi:hypothetical protein